MSVLVLVVLALASAAHAGPWQRAPGEHFASLSYETSTYASSYLERGLRDGWTVGLDAGGNDTGYRKTYLFLRRSYHQSSQSPFALELGLGRQSTHSGTAFALRPAVHWGRNITLFHAPGWFTTSASAAHIPSRQTTVFKSETTLGLSTTPRVLSMIQVTLEQETGQPLTTKFTPSVGVRLNDRLTLVGATVFENEQPASFKLSLWMTF